MHMLARVGMYSSLLERPHMAPGWPPTPPRRTWIWYVSSAKMANVTMEETADQEPTSSMYLIISFVFCAARD